MTMTKKTDLVKEAIRNSNWKEALKIAKGFRINVTAGDRDKMTRAYECIVHPRFYEQIGTNIPDAIEQGKKVVARLYG